MFLTGLLLSSSHERYQRLNCCNNEIASLPDFLCTLPLLNAYVPRASGVTDMPRVLTAFFRLWCDNNKLTALPERVADMKSLRRWAVAAVSVPCANLWLAP